MEIEWNALAKCPTGRLVAWYFQLVAKTVFCEYCNLHCKLYGVYNSSKVVNYKRIPARTLQLSRSHQKPEKTVCFEVINEDKARQDPSPSLSLFTQTESNCDLFA